MAENTPPEDSGRTWRNAVLDGLSKATVADLMIPRPEVVLINAKSTFPEITDLVISDGHSRFPVFSEKIDNIVGILYVKDLLQYFKAIEVDFDISRILRKPLFVSENKRANELLSDLRDARVHMGIVVDEYGTMMGIITLEDILEQIVGDISDEYDKEDRKDYEEIGQNEYLVKARMTLEEFNRLLRVTIRCKDYDTVGGFLIHRFGYVPKPGEKLNHRNLVFEVRHAHGSRLKEILVRKV